MPTLRELGYRVREQPASPVRRMLERNGSRLVALNRQRPGAGHHYTACPRCGRGAALFIHPGEDTWSSICGCFAGDSDAFDLLLALYGVPA